MCPGRPEEALERYIVGSNGGNFYNQIPIGGRKESIDIGIARKDAFTFIELKPWRSANSPLYALVESLKNLVEYTIIHERKIKDNLKHRKVQLGILAPHDYYVRYGIAGGPSSVLKNLLRPFAEEFGTNIAFYSFHLSEHDFLQKCKALYRRQALEGQAKAYVSESDRIASLDRANWQLVASSLQ